MVVDAVVEAALFEVLVVREAIDDVVEDLLVALDEPAGLVATAVAVAHVAS